MEVNIEIIKDVAKREALQRQWRIIEDLYAYASFNGHETIPDDDIKIIEGNLREIYMIIKDNI